MKHRSNPIGDRRLLVVQALAIGVLLLVACSDDGSSTAGTVEREPLTTATDSASPPVGNTNDDPTPTDVPEEVVLTPLAQLDSLTAMAPHPETGVLYVTERDGRVIPVDPATGHVGDVVVDISAEVTTGSESGLLGLTFSPEGDRLYLSYSDLDNATTTIEFPFEDGIVDASGRRLIFAQEQPFPNHNGGEIRFGPDGYLYIGLGDGGSAGDPLGSGQDTATTLGAILRVDPLADCGIIECVGDASYAIPPDNPFVDGEAPEVWTYGARNPWRFSFDTETGDLWVGDVGQNLIEEIDFLPAPDAGRAVNLGWSDMEGTQPFDEETAPGDHVPPVHEYSHEGGNCSVTGGYVYRGSALPFLDGVYLYGDYCVGDLFGIRVEAASAVEQFVLDLNVGDDQLASFGQDNDGEVYVLTLGGTLYRLDGA